MARSKIAILQEIQALCDELNEILQLEERNVPEARQVPPDPNDEDEDPTGKEVVITSTKLKGKRALVVRKRSSFSLPNHLSFWYLRLCDNQEEICRKRSNFRVVAHR